ncbi:uncharacterized protein LOC130531226 [Takifugu flavidus]|uniref:uncharacterized protein LOC130531226 n=1 Tax=Takifugu flavidus TaxID=433684 RepID=UPI0025444CEA|nr:uncharacterized protein LOC130531226 [Takifugu flavidus]
MILFNVALLLLHQGYALVPVTLVQLGEPVTLTCVLPKEIARRQIHWYKQSAGESLSMVVTYNNLVKPMYGADFSASRLQIKEDEGGFNLTILETISGDEGMYHCALIDYFSIRWSASYLLIEGETQMKANRIVHNLTVCDPVCPEESVALQCSVLSEFHDNSCSGGLSVYWFKAGRDSVHMIYARGNDECEQSSDNEKSCIYHLSINASTSVAETYYCAVATCGEIWFGKGTKVDFQGVSMWTLTPSGTSFLLCGFFTVNLIAVSFLIYTIKTNKHEWNKTAARQSAAQQKEQGLCVYSAVTFMLVKTERDGRKEGRQSAEEQRTYAAVRAFGLD